MTCIHFDPKHRPAKHARSGKDLETHDYHDLIDKLADKVEDKVIAWRRDMHQNPELPNREFRTAKLIADHLKSLHFDEVRTKVGVTGVVGLLKGEQPGDKVVAFHADFDALPVKELADVPFKSTRIDKDYPGGPFPVSHACGGVYLFLGSQDSKWTEKGLEPIDPKKSIPFNHNPHYYVKDEVLKTGIRMPANVVMDFLTGQI